MRIHGVSAAIGLLVLNYDGGAINAQFSRDAEGLNGQPAACPF